ncbi:hypothetical protein E2C01_045690 [Portunus trituberculatus]|uniref:Uncharacterized protein n=1 Tax=Portunus trituberculatus TaxID=210409 RepID=A0A5B7G223_PORTR|nr:hypothetical protein [Portunus trituberculatus]
MRTGIGISILRTRQSITEDRKEGNEEEPVCGPYIKTLRECLGGIKKALETLKERDPNPARSSKVAHDVKKSVKIYQEIYDVFKKQEKPNSPPSTHSSNQSDMLSLSQLLTLLQLVLPPYPPQTSETCRPCYSWPFLHILFLETSETLLQLALPHLLPTVQMTTSYP